MSFGYGIAVGQFLARARAQGRDSVPLGSLLAAHALDVLDPGKLTLNATQIAYNGVSFTGVDQLAPVLDVPGVRLQTPTIASGDGVVSTSSPPSEVLADFHVHDLVVELGQENLDYLDELKGLWRDHIAPLGFITDYQLGRIMLLLDAGIIAVPASSTYLTNLGYRSDLRTVATQFQDAWTKVIAIFKPANDAYASKNFATAVSEARAAAANAALWDEVYAAVEFVKDAPVNIAKGAAEVGGYAIGSLGWKNWLVIAGVAAVVLVSLSAPSLAAGAAAKFAKGAA